MDSLLELMSSSGISSMSVSLCPFWLKCCGTASVVLFCMAVYDALQICHVVRVLFVRCILPGVLLEHLKCFCIFGILDHVDEVFGCTSDCLLDMMYLAYVFERTWWQTVLNEGAGFAFLWVTFLDSWRACLLCLCIFYFCFHEKIAEVAWASVCDELFFRKKLLCNGLKTEVWESV